MIDERDIEKLAAEAADEDCRELMQAAKENGKDIADEAVNRKLRLGSQMEVDND